MINEGRGISELNKKETENIFNIFLNKSFHTFEYQILNRIIEITFKEGNYNSKFYKNLGKCFLLFTCPKNYNQIKLKSIITHELNHFIEVSKIEDKKFRYPNYNKIKKSLIEFNPNNKQLDFFKHIIYKTIDNEINAVVSQTYTYLRSFDSNNELFLKEKLEDYNVRQEYKNLLDFNISKFKSDLISNNINFNTFNSILLKNGVGNFLDFINKDVSVEKYVDYWFKIIKSNINKLLKKQEIVIKEVIEDINNLENYSTEYPLNEKTLLTYYEYLNENLSKIKK